MTKLRSEQQKTTAPAWNVMLGLLGMIVVSILIGFDLNLSGLSSGAFCIAAGVVGAIQLLWRIIRRRSSS